MERMAERPEPVMELERILGGSRLAHETIARELQGLIDRESG